MNEEKRMGRMKEIIKYKESGRKIKQNCTRTAKWRKTEDKIRKEKGSKGTSW